MKKLIIFCLAILACHMGSVLVCQSIDKLVLVKKAQKKVPFYQLKLHRTLLDLDLQLQQGLGLRTQMPTRMHYCQALIKNLFASVQPLIWQILLILFTLMVVGLWFYHYSWRPLVALLVLLGFGLYSSWQVNVRHVAILHGNDIPIYSGPSQNYPLIKRTQANNIVRVEKQVDDFWRVISPKVSGWIEKQYLVFI